MTSPTMQICHRLGPLPPPRSPFLLKSTCFVRRLNSPATQKALLGWFMTRREALLWCWRVHLSIAHLSVAAVT